MLPLEQDQPDLLLIVGSPVLSPPSKTFPTAKNQLYTRTISQGSSVSLQMDSLSANMLKCLPFLSNLHTPGQLHRLYGYDKYYSVISSLKKIYSSPRAKFATTLLNLLLARTRDSAHCNNSSLPREGMVFLLLPYSTDGHGHMSIFGIVQIVLTYVSSVNRSPLRLTSIWDSLKLYVQPRTHILNAVFSINLCCAGPRPSLLLCYLGSNRSTRSSFWFLRYAGLRSLPSSRKILIDEDGYLVTHIGQGAFAVISRVLYRPTGEVRVMKRITFDDSGLAKYLAKNEVDTLKAVAGGLWFPRLINEFAEGNQFVVTMPYYRRGDLAGYMQHKRHLGREIAKFYCAQLVLAIHSLHKVGIVHRDVKPDNIFLDEDGHLVLADFGLAENIAYQAGEDLISQFPLWHEARSRNDEDFPFLWLNRYNPLSMRGVAGTFWYTAPEVFRKERYSFGVDYWSVAVIYHELITGHIPFNHYKPYPANKCPELDFRRKPGQLKDIEAWEEKSLSEFLSPYPTDRPKTLTDIKNSRIFREIDWISMSQRKIRPPSLPPPLLEDNYPYPSALPA